MIKALMGAMIAMAVMMAAPALAQTVEYIHTDALGTPIAVTDANRNVIERSEYAPYGELLNRPATDGPGYTGHVQDAATGMTYMQQRYYDPVLGRFMSVDPVTALDGGQLHFNRYVYAYNNPYKFTDPDGRCPMCVPIIFGIMASLHSEPANAPALGERTVGGSPTDALDAVPGGGPAVRGVRMTVRAVDRLSQRATGRGANKLKPDQRATGDHSTIKRDANGNTTNTATYTANPQNPSGFQETKRVDVTGKPHRNPDGTVVPTPHVKEAGGKGVRPARPDELPRK